MKILEWDASDFGEGLCGFTCKAELRAERDGGRVAWIEIHGVEKHLADAITDWWHANSDSFIDKWLDEEAATKDDHEYHAGVDDGLAPKGKT